MELQGMHWIGGEAFAGGRPTGNGAPGDTEFRAIDPTTGEPVGPTYVDATTDEIDRALSLAAAAHNLTKDRPRTVWAQLLEGIADGLESLGDPLLETAHRETGLPLARLTGERGRTCAQLRAFADAVREGSWLEPRIDRAQPERAPIPKPDVRSVRRPLGPVVVFGASNFPLAFSVAGGDTASALAAGCPVVFKAHPAHPGTSELVAQVIRAAVVVVGLPPGAFSLLHGRAPAVGAALVEHPQTRAVGFTGSLAGGKALFDLAMARPRPIPVFAEMGSVNPVLLLPEALAEGAEALAQATAGSVTLGVGQFCTNPGLLLALDGPDTETFASELARRLNDGAAGTLLHPGIHQAYSAGTARLDATDGVTRRTRSTATVAEDGPCEARPALYQVPAERLLDDPTLAEEVFGPTTVLVTAADRTTLQRVLEGLGGQLTATIHGTDDDLAQWPGLVDTLEDLAGRVLFGGMPTGVEVCPAMVHGGPFPATTDAASTSVGLAAIRRFSRPVCYQDAPEGQLPSELRDANPEGLLRMIDGAWSRESLG